MSYTVNFTDTSTPGPRGPITAWHWDFGDGSTSTVQNPSHAYAVTGLYSVELTITGTGADGQATTILPVIVLDTSLLTAEFSSSPTLLTVDFTDLSTPGPSGPITGWSWTFGDGGTSTSQNPSHSYASSGTRSVQLTVTGTSPDGTANKTHSVTVSSASDIFDEWIAACNADSDAARPTTMPISSSPHYKPFTTITQMQSLLASAVAGDYIFYDGSGVLTSSGTSNAVLSLTGHNYGGRVTLDLGTYRSVWDNSLESSDYVQINYTGTGLGSPVGLSNCTNLTIYGGRLHCTNGYGNGILLNAPLNQIDWYDPYFYNCGLQGIAVRGQTGSGAASTTQNIFFRAEVDGYAMDPARDNHADKGTGLHACQLHGGGAIKNCKWMIYGHDPLAPGATSHGVVWPEGGGGSVVEPGQENLSDNSDNHIVYAFGENLLMKNGSPYRNPGTTGYQIGGNVIEAWGNSKLNDWVFEFIAGRNITGCVWHGAGSNWQGTSGHEVVVNHGRHVNTNQFLASSGGVAGPYDRRLPQPIYHDCT